MDQSTHPPVAPTLSAESLSRRRFGWQMGLLASGLAAATAAGLTPSAGAQEVIDPTANVALIQRYYETYGQGNPDALRPFFAEDIVWRIPGQHPLSGDKVGADEVLAFFEQLNMARFGAEPIVLAAAGDWVIDLHRGFNTEGEGTLDILWALAFRIENEQIAEAINFAFDQAAANAFFWANYPLRPIPDRLADVATA